MERSETDKIFSQAVYRQCNRRRHGVSTNQNTGSQIFSNNECRTRTWTTQDTHAHTVDHRDR